MHGPQVGTGGDSGILDSRKFVPPVRHNEFGGFAISEFANSQVPLYMSLVRSPYIVTMRVMWGVVRGFAPC